MVFSLTWLPDVLESAGLKVAEQPGWRTRGHGDVGHIKGVICHHTAGAKFGNMPSLTIVTTGRPDLAGPLCQLGLGRDGTFYVVAAGRAFHAGPGVWKGVATGNSSFIGIEAENTGLDDDDWPGVQMDAYARGVAAILKKIGADESMCCGHKEYATPHGRKTDPTFDMNAFRKEVGVVLNGGGTAPALIPAMDGQNRPTLRRGDSNDFVKQVQVKLGVTADGAFGASTEAEVRRFERAHGMVPDGIWGPKCWAMYDTHS